MKSVGHNKLLSFSKAEYWLWPRLLWGIHWVAMTLIWAILYFVIFAPFSLVTRVLRGDVLRIRWKAYESMWVEEPTRDDSIDNLKKSF